MELIVTVSKNSIPRFRLMPQDIFLRYLENHLRTFSLADLDFLPLLSLRFIRRMTTYKIKTWLNNFLTTPSSLEISLAADDEGVRFIT